MQQGPPIKVAPAIMDTDLARIAGAVQSLEAAGVDMLHVDIMDGHYVPSLVGGRRVVAAIRREASIPVDVHLMVTNPHEAADWFIGSGADTLLFHPEMADNPESTIDRIHAAGRRAGIVLNPGMEVDEGAGLYEMVECVMAMTVMPGKSGQSFMEDACQIIPRLRRRCSSDTDIYVDGGIGGETAHVAASYGANVFAAASAFFASERSFTETTKMLRSRAQRARQDKMPENK
jgi:ribulose-phosphate 3-epimerase